MDPEILQILLIVLAIGAALLVASVPVGVVLAVASTIGFYLVTGSFGAATSLLQSTSFDVTSSLPYLVIPMFILMGLIASSTGIVKDLFDAAYKLVGRVSGGVAIATCLASAGFGAVTGSSMSATAAMGKIALPELRRYKYDLKLSAGAIAASGTFAMIIPPSLVLVFYGIVAQESIGKLLVAGLVPGGITVVVYSLQMYVRARIRPELAPRGPAFPMREVVVANVRAAPFLLVLATLIGGLLAGIWTPTEASAGGVAVVLLIGVLKKSVTLRGVLEAGKDTMVTTAAVFLLVIGSILFGKFLAFSGVTQAVVDVIISADLPPLVFFACLIVFYIVLGTFLEAISIIALTVPLMLPITQQLGWDPIWFGIVLVKLIEIGAMTPPVGLNLYTLKGVAPDVPIKTIVTGCVPFWLCDIALLFLLYAIPEIVLILPRLVS